MGGLVAVLKKGRCRSIRGHRPPSRARGIRKPQRSEAPPMQRVVAARESHVATAAICSFRLAKNIARI
jgi:hypothetical protein